jgi:hypothetical protein
MKLEHSFEKQKHLLMLKSLPHAELLKAAELLLDNLYAQKEFIEVSFKTSLGID